MQYRPVAINLADRPKASQCHDCGARHIGLCGALSDDDLALLTRVAQSIAVAAGQLLVDEGAPAAHFFNINRGTVRLFKSLPDGRRQITGFMGVGQFLGLKVTTQPPAGAVYAFGAEAIDDVQLCRFGRAGLISALEDFPALEHRLLAVASDELVAAQDQMLLLGRKTARERLASFLLAWAAQTHHLPADAIHAGAALAVPMTRTDLADYLGLTIETVSRTLSQLRRDGLVAIHGAHEIALLKPREIAAIAHNLAG